MSCKEPDPIQQASEHLIRAAYKQQEITTLTDLYPNLSVEEAYQVQLHTVRRKVQDGYQIIGKKIGLTSTTMQRLFGTNHPEYGHLLNGMQIPNRGSILVDHLFRPKVETHIAFVLKRDLSGPHVTIDEVWDATEFIIPSIEITDSRMNDRSNKLQDLIADNASSGFFVLGNKRVWHEFDLSRVKVKVFKNGRWITDGLGSAVWSDPATCVAWLANRLHQYGGKLEEGEIILSGALSETVIANKGDRFTADFAHLGQVELTFT